MLRTPLAMALAGAVAFAAPAAHRSYDPESRLARQLDGLVAGAPVDCITPSGSGGGGHAGNLVLVKDRSGVLYRASFNGGCYADEGDALISIRPTTQLCRGDIVNIQDLTSGVSRGSCGYSAFTPYRRPR